MTRIAGAFAVSSSTSSAAIPVCSPTASRQIETLTGWPSIGVMPWFPNAHALPAEDALDIASVSRDGAALKIVVPVLPRIANFDDVDPLKLDPSVDLRMISPGTPLPLDADLVIIPGSKSTIADLGFLRQQGWDIDIAAHVRRGGHVLGLCGGYQMLGDTIADPDGIEGPAGVVPGLGLLAVDSVLTNDKTVRAVTARHAASDLELHAYEIHLGLTTGTDTTRAPFSGLESRRAQRRRMGASSALICMACSAQMRFAKHSSVR